MLLAFCAHPEARGSRLAPAEDKMRLLMIYVNTQDGIKQDERRQLLTLARQRRLPEGLEHLTDGRREAQS